MQKFIRFALPCVCFAVIIWCCLFGGFNHIDWKLLLGAAVVGGVCWVVLYVKQHNILGKIEEHRNQLKMVAEEAVAPELEKVKGSRFKKELVKRRMGRDDRHQREGTAHNDAPCGAGYGETQRGQRDKHR